MSQQPPHVQADPATLASLLRPRVSFGGGTPAQREYVRHYDGCLQCQGATDAAGLCSLGKHLYAKLTRGDEA